MRLVFYAASMILFRKAIEASDNSYDRDDIHNISTTRNPRLRYYSSEGIDSPGEAPIQFVINPATVRQRHKMRPYDYVGSSPNSTHHLDYRQEAEEKIFSKELSIDHIVAIQLFSVPKGFSPNYDDEHFLKDNGGYRKTYQIIINDAKKLGIPIQDFRRKRKPAIRLKEIDALTHDANKAISQGKKLSFVPDEEERKALLWYRDGGYENMNTLLHGKEPEDDPEQMMTDYGFEMDTDAGIRHLDNVIKKAPKRKKVIYAYRGERSEYHAKKLLAMEIGESYSTPAFTSASLSASFAYYAFASSNGLHILSMFIIPPSFPAAYISNNDHTEMEVLLMRGTTFTLKEKRVIPNKDRPHFKNTPITLLVWSLEPPQHIDSLV